MPRLPFETCHLHIGIEKTGSTSLQRTCSRFADALDAAGFVYPTRSGRQHTFLRHHVVAATLSAEERAGRQEFRPPRLAEIDERVSALSSELTARSAKNIIISSEVFCGIKTPAIEALERYLSRYVQDIRPIAYVRHPVSFSMSMLQQYIKTGSQTIDDLDKVSGRNILRGRLERWIQHFGRDACRVVPFHRGSLADGDISRDFLLRIGIDPKTLNPPILQANESLSAPAVYLKSRMNRLALSRKAQVFDRPYLATIPGPRFSLPPEQVERLSEACGEDLEWLLATTGTALSAPAIPPFVDERDAFDDAATRRIRAIAREPRNFRSSLEKEAFDAALAGLEVSGIVVFPRTRWWSAPLPLLGRARASARKAAARMRHGKP